MKIYNICGKSGLQIKMHCLPSPYNYREHAFLPFAYNIQSLVFGFLGLVLLCSCGPRPWKSHGSIQRVSRRTPHTFLSFAVSTSFNLPLPGRGSEGSIYHIPKQKNKSSVDSPPLGSGGFHTTFPCEHCEDQEKCGRPGTAP